MKTIDFSNLNEGDIEKILSIIRSLEIIFFFENQTLKVDDSNLELVKSVVDRFVNPGQPTVATITGFKFDFCRFLKSKLLLSFLALMLAVLTITILKSNVSVNSSKPSGKNNASESAQTTSSLNLKTQWWPSSFTGIPPFCTTFGSATCNQEFAYSEVPGARCPALTSGCAVIMIYSRIQCSNVYVELKLVDPFDTNLGFVNSVVSNMGPGETALVTLPWYVNGVDGYNFNEVSCT